MTYSSLSFTGANTCFCDFFVVELLFYRKLMSATWLQAYQALLLSCMNKEEKSYKKRRM